jgi:hypothetical protein
VGTTTNTFRVTDAGGLTAVCSFTITVIDNQLPVFNNCPANISLAAIPGSCEQLGMYIAPVGTDNCPGAVTTFESGLGNSVMYPVGVSTNVYKVTDAAGLTNFCSFTITITDTELPVISCPTSFTAQIPPGDCDIVVTYNAPTTSDNCPGETYIQTAGLVSGSVFPPGVTNNVFRVTDASGNQATCSFTVTAELQIRTLNVKAYLEGFYNGSGMNAAMDYDINSNYVPKWGATIADMVTVELHDAADYGIIVHTEHNVPLHTDGTLTVEIPAVYSGSYFVTVRQRNHLETPSATALSFAGCAVSHDFTTGTGQAYDGNMKVMSGKSVFFGGDISSPGYSYPNAPVQDGGVDLFDVVYVFQSYLAGDFGYDYVSDINGDGTVDLPDIFIAFINYTQNVTVSLP